MKLISFLSKFTFICNICFLLFIIFSKLEAGKPATGTPGTVVTLPLLKDLVIVLGFSAIIINLVMCIVYLVILLLGKAILLPRWLSITNGIFLLVEFYFFFFYN